MLYFIFLTFCTAHSFVHNNKLIKPKLYATQNILPSIEVKNFFGQSLGNPWSYTDLFDYSDEKMIKAISITDDGKNAIAIDKLGSEASNLHVVHLFPENVNSLLDHLIKNNVNVDLITIPKNEFFEIFSKVGEAFYNISIYFIVFTFMVNFVLAFRNRNQDGSGGNFGMSNNILNPTNNKNINFVDSSSLNTTFANVAGCEEAKYELMEVVDFLKNKDKFEEAGAKIPKGVLLEGPPGTGKTLLAKAVAGEADVPFLSVSGSEFIEVFVGVGASRARALFEKAKENAPCVVFIDEIDAIGRKRGAGIAGGNDEREQTLNQILTNMDGFSSSEGVVVLAATNRIDILDAALTRPGRFDRKVTVGVPDTDGRKEIMKVHFRNKKLDSSVNFDELAQLTPGFSGADIANLANEAAIFSVRNNATEINRKHVLDAYEKMTIGLVSNTQTVDQDIIELVSNHEIGHALLTALFDDMFVLRKITINENKSGAGGYTLFTPKERFQKYATKKFMLANLIIALGGRAAEVFLYSKNEKSKKDDRIFTDFNDLEVTTGASNDLKQANNIARKYITEYGFGHILAQTDDTTSGDHPFMGRDFEMEQKKLSDNTKFTIDTQVNMLVHFAFTKALDLINENNVAFRECVELLKQKRIVDGDEIYSIIEKNKICYECSADDDCNS
tara:strand:+ start:9691 stop:11706 length:2016 start_codon:yes stop_codon:yes gene_type:complete